MTRGGSGRARRVSSRSAADAPRLGLQYHTPGNEARRPAPTRATATTRARPLRDPRLLTPLPLLECSQQALVGRRRCRTGAHSPAQPSSGLTSYSTEPAVKSVAVGPGRVRRPAWALHCAIWVHSRAVGRPLGRHPAPPAHPLAVSTGARKASGSGLRRKRSQREAVHGFVGRLRFREAF